nr:hypothetical protein [Tanacetum cinerariifolium]
PKQPGNDIDDYLAPLIDDMKTLWQPSVEVYDAYKNEMFRLRAMIFCTINDFPAYGNLSGYSTKDMVQMGFQLELAPVENDRKCTYLPSACYTMSKAEKHNFVNAYTISRFPLVIMQILRGWFPLKIIRSSVTPEGSIVEGHATKEVVEFCTDYLKGIDNIGIPRSRHQGKDPLLVYTDLNIEDWPAFVAIRNSPAFKVKEKIAKARANALKNTDRHRMGRISYVGLEKKLVPIMLSDNDFTSLKELTNSLYDKLKALALGTFKRTRKKTKTITVEDFDGMKDEITKPLIKNRPYRSRLGATSSELELGQIIYGFASGDLKLGHAFYVLQTPTPCNLLVPYGDIEETMAKAMLYPRFDGMLNGIQIRQGYSKVHVDIVEDAYANNCVMVPTDDLSLRLAPVEPSMPTKPHLDENVLQRMN